MWLMVAILCSMFTSRLCDSVNVEDNSKKLNPTPEEIIAQLGQHLLSVGTIDCELERVDAMGKKTMQSNNNPFISIGQKKWPDWLPQLPRLPFGMPILHISLIVPRAPGTKTGTELMFTLEISQQPSVAFKLFLTYVEGITYFMNKKFLLRELRYKYSSEVQFTGSLVQQLVMPRNLMEHVFGIEKLFKDVTSDIFDRIKEEHEKEEKSVDFGQICSIVVKSLSWQLEQTKIVQNIKRSNFTLLNRKLMHLLQPAKQESITPIRPPNIVTIPYCAYRYKKWPRLVTQYEKPLQSVIGYSRRKVPFLTQP